MVLVVGFVHMLLPAQETLTSPCLSEGWLSAYPSFAFLFAVLTIIFLQCLEYWVNSIIDDKYVEEAPATPPAAASPVSAASAACSSGACADHCATQAAAAENGECVQHSVCKDEECGGRVLLANATPAVRAKTLSALALSEGSIALHSIIIGLALGVTSSSAFTALFIAIIFHQASGPLMNIASLRRRAAASLNMMSFLGPTRLHKTCRLLDTLCPCCPLALQLLEGLALGSACVHAGLRTRTTLLLAVLFALTTPVGIAAGIGVHRSLDGNSTPLLLTTGILESLSAGTLIFLALGDHMNAIRAHGDWLRVQSLAIKLTCFAAFFTGAAALLVIALWA